MGLTIQRLVGFEDPSLFKVPAFIHSALAERLRLRFIDRQNNAKIAEVVYLSHAAVGANSRLDLQAVITEHERLRSVFLETIPDYMQAASERSSEKHPVAQDARTLAERFKDKDVQKRFQQLKEQFDAKHKEIDTED